MKTQVLLPLLLLPLACTAQIFDVDTIVFNGGINQRINIIVLGDGYQAGEFDKFMLDANNFRIALFAEQPYATYRNYFNFFIIKVPSNESGADHPGTATDVPEPAHPVLVADTYFGATFDVFNIHRLVAVTEEFKVINVLATNFPQYDQVFIMANSPYYGGSGGPQPVATTHSLANEIAIHEMGHSFAGLKDEYWAGDFYANEAVNMTQVNNPALVKWKNWYNTNDIGIFQYCCGGTSSFWYKPSNAACKMEVLSVPFCSVCKEATVETIHDLINPIESFTPTAQTLPSDGNGLTFKLNLILPVPNTLNTRWQLNGSFLAAGVDSLTLFSGNLEEGVNTLTVSVEDTTQFLRVDGHETIHYYTVTWTIEKAVNAVEVKSSPEKYRLELFPNPAGDYVNIAFESQQASIIKVELYNLKGELLNVQDGFSTPGSSTSFLINLEPYQDEILLVKVSANGRVIVTKKLARG